MKYLFLTLSVVALTSCGGWVGGQKEAFMKQCKDGFKEGFERNANGAEYPSDKVDAYCTCAQEKAEEAYPNWDDYVDNQSSAKAKKIYAECFKEHFGEDMGSDVSPE